tara:strand:- start:330 stop:515 length:186 start_codon:yes stop_codon:yes gene_type:complete
MNSQTTDAEWRLFADSLRQRKSQLIADLSEDYSATLSVKAGITRQIECIDILLEEVPFKFR